MTPPQSNAELRDTYHAALQHGHANPDREDFVLGVVREPMYGIETHLDDNWQVLAPPRELLHEFKQRADDLGHNAAVDAVNFRERYREHLSGAPRQEKLQQILDRLDDGQNVWLVCYENTDEKFCHREILKDVLQARRP